MSASKVQRLDQVVRAVCPVEGVSVPTPGESRTVRIDFAGDATPAQRLAAQAAVNAFDWSDAAQAIWEGDRNPDRKAVRDLAVAAAAANAAYLVIPTPTAAQVAAQVRALTQQSSAVIRRLVQID